MSGRDLTTSELMEFTHGLAAPWEDGNAGTIVARSGAPLYRPPPRSWAMWRRAGTRRPSGKKLRRPSGQSACGAASRSRFSSRIGHGYISAHRRPRYATEAVRALRHALAKHLERPAEDLDRATVVHALDSLSRHKDKGRKTDASSRGTAIAGRTAAYGRACFSWAMKRGTVPSNPFAELPIPSAVNKRDRNLAR